MVHYICTAGTSILGDKARTANESEVAKLVKERLEQLGKGPDALKRLSAETNSLKALGASKQDRVTFLVTETPVGVECARQLVSIVSEKLLCETGYEIIKGLQVEDARKFRTIGISSLYEAIGILREKYPVKTLLNVTGGFKSVVPYTALYGLLHCIDIAYLFESSNELIMLPPAPVGINYEKASLVRGLLMRLKKEALIRFEDYQSVIEKTPFEDRDWLEGLFCQEDGMVYLSAFGQIVVETAVQETLAVFLSENARRGLERATGKSLKQLHLILQRIGDPLWRDSHIDPNWAKVTNLMVAKPGNVSERGAYFLKGGKVYICELYVNHDEYERHLTSRRIEDYSDQDFIPYVPSDEELPQEGSDEDYLRILEDNRALSKENDSLVARLEASEEKWIAENDSVKKMQSELEVQHAVLTEYESLRKSLWKRLVFMFSGKMK